MFFVERMESVKAFGRDAIKQGGITNLWIGRNYFVGKYLGILFKHI